MTVNERIKDLLKASKHTQKELSEAIQVPRATVGTWVNGRDIPAQFIIPICGFLECSAQYLLTGQEIKKEPILGEISENGRKMLDVFKDLSFDEQNFLIGEATGMRNARLIRERKEPPAPASDAKAV